MSHDGTRNLHSCLFWLVYNTFLFALNAIVALILFAVGNNWAWLTVLCSIYTGLTAHWNFSILRDYLCKSQKQNP